MPNGFGTYKAGASNGSSRSALGDVPIRPGGTGLAAAALTAIHRLAAASGHPIAIPTPAATEARSGTSDAAEIVAFTAGAALIALAWTASLRARPPRLPRRRATST